MPSIILLSSPIYSGETFVGGEAGISVPETVCKSTAVGISVDVNTYEPHLLAGTMAHMIGHNIGMGHDDNRKIKFIRFYGNSYNFFYCILFRWRVLLSRLAWLHHGTINCGFGKCAALQVFWMQPKWLHWRSTNRPWIMFTEQT